METYALHTDTGKTPRGFIEFRRTPYREEVLEALMIRGDIIGLARDVWDCYYVCQGGSGTLLVIFRPQQRIAFQLKPV